MVSTIVGNDTFKMWFSVQNDETVLQTLAISSHIRNKDIIDYPINTNYDFKDKNMIDDLKCVRLSIIIDYSFSSHTNNTIPIESFHRFLRFFNLFRYGSTRFVYNDLNKPQLPTLFINISLYDAIRLVKAYIMTKSEYSFSNINKEMEYILRNVKYVIDNMYDNTDNTELIKELSAYNSKYVSCIEEYFTDSIKISKNFTNIFGYDKDCNIGHSISNFSSFYHLEDDQITNLLTDKVYNTNMLGGFIISPLSYIDRQFLFVNKTPNEILMFKHNADILNSLSIVIIDEYHEDIFNTLHSIIMCDLKDLSVLTDVNKNLKYTTTIISGPASSIYNFIVKYLNIGNSELINELRELYIV